MADYEDASTAAFKEVLGDMAVFGCWFHCAQSVVKRLQKLGSREAHVNDTDVIDTVRCLLGEPLLPRNDILGV